MRTMVLTALMGAAVMVSGPARAATLFFNDFSSSQRMPDESTYGRFRIANGVVGHRVNYLANEKSGYSASFSTMPGQTYTLTFDYDVQTATERDYLDVTAGGQFLNRFSEIQAGTASYNFVGDGSLATADFDFTSGGGTGRGVQIDNVRIADAAAPGAPGPLAGLGLLPALTGVGTLIATRVRRRKAVAA